MKFFNYMRGKRLQYSGNILVNLFSWTVAEQLSSLTRDYWGTNPLTTFNFSWCLVYTICKTPNNPILLTHSRCLVYNYLKDDSVRIPKQFHHKHSLSPPYKDLHIHSPPLKTTLHSSIDLCIHDPPLSTSTSHTDKLLNSGRNFKTGATYPSEAAVWARHRLATLCGGGWRGPTAASLDGGLAIPTLQLLTHQPLHLLALLLVRRAIRLQRGKMTIKGKDKEQW